ETIDHARAKLPEPRRSAFDRHLAGIKFRSALQPRPLLTPAERRGLHTLHSTPTTAEVANTLGVSINTVKSQLQALYRKLDVNSRTDAIAAGERFSLFTDSLGSPR